MPAADLGEISPGRRIASSDVTERLWGLHRKHCDGSVAVSVTRSAYIVKKEQEVREWQRGRGQSQPDVGGGDKNKVGPPDV